MITYNHARYIAEAIESVMAQITNFDFELVIGEDCSNDATRNIVKSFQDKYPERIRVIYNEKNMGPVLNCLQVFKACKGKYVALLEGDDYWIDNKKLQKQADFLEQNKDYAMIHTDLLAYYQKDDKFVNPIKLHPIPVGNIYEKVLIYPFIGTCTMMVRKSALFRYLIEFKKEIPEWKFADLSLKLYLAFNYKIGYDNELTSVYRIADGSLTRQSDFIKKAHYLQEINKIELFFAKKYGCSETTLIKLNNIINERCFYISFYLDQKSNIKSFYKKLNKKSLKIKIYYLATVSTIFRKLTFRAYSILHS
jgi:glycosyltransferase involved in cell wall biosynthesis